MNTDPKQNSDPAALRSFTMLPPAPDLCQICAIDHEPSAPHNAQTLYYQMAFHNAVGRDVTWADAIAHCTPKVQEEWRAGLTFMGEWTEPEAGAEPVQHFGTAG